MDGRVVVSGTVTASGCATAAMDGTFTDIKVSREDEHGLEIELEREDGPKVKLKAKVRRTG